MRIHVQPLEQRRLLTIAISGGILQINGSDSANTLELVLNGSTIQLRNSTTLAVADSIAAAGVTGANVNMLGGNDLFRIGRPDGTMMPNITVTIHGGTGDDSLTGGNNNDQIFGDDGNDLMDGRAGGDVIDGGTGFDTADYSYRARQLKITLDNNANDGTNAGDNSSPAQYNDAFGDNVKSTTEAVLGGAGNDSLVGNAGANWFDGGAGNDSIYAGDGTDTINGGVGADLAYGEGGDDYFFVQDNLGDKFLGGAGTTFAQYDTTVDTPAPTLTTSPSSTALTTMALSFAPASFQPVSNVLDELQPDTTFGTSGTGRVITQISGTLAQINDVAIQKIQTSPGVFEEKIVAVGTAIGPRGDYDMFVARFNANGALDTTFGPSHTGKVYADFSTGIGYTNDTASSLVIGAGGKIIVAGATARRYDFFNTTLNGYADFAVARFLSNGSLDTSFSGDGLTTLDAGGLLSDDRASRIAIQNITTGNTTEERYVIAGTLGDDDAFFPKADFGMVRLKNSGSLDNAFGLIRTGFGFPWATQDYATGLAIDPATNNIWVSGYSGTYPGNFDFAVAGYKSTGAPIPGARTTLDLGGSDKAFDAVISGSELLVIGDSVYNGFSDGAIAAFSIGQPGIPAGTVLNSNYVFDSSGLPVDLRGLSIDNEGRGVAVGSLGGSDFYVSRFDTSDLSQIGDPVTVDFGSTDVAFAVAVQSDDKLVLAGLSGDDAALVRLQPKKWVDVQLSPEDVQAFQFTYVDENNQVQDIPNVLVAKVKALLPDGTLAVDGTSGNDTITVTQSNGNIEVNVNGDLLDVNADQVTKVVIRGLEGDDSISTDGSLAVPMSIDGGDGNDTLTGSAGPDTFTGGAGIDTVDYSGRTQNLNISIDGVANDGAAGENDNVGTDVEVVIGGLGNDTITGGVGNDSIFGGAGNDSLNGGDGDDLFDGGPGADVLTGGAGNDTADYSSRTENLNISLDDIANDGAAGENDNVGSDVEVVIGGSGDDSITGNTANNTLIGGGGNDLLDGGLGADVLSGGEGTDTVNYASRTENLNISLDGVANDGAAGENDNVGTDVEVVIGGSGNDIITGSTNDNTLIGGDGDDSITGGIGNDSIVGGAGNDSLYGSDGNDTIVGGDGNDLLDGGLGSDSLVGGAGTDTASYASRTENLNITLDGIANDGAAGENDNVGADIEVVIGGSGDDIITGNTANNTLIGGDGNDLLDGGLGADSLVGGAGTDTASYASRTENLTITLDGVANDGATGENDNVGTDIEVVVGGSGNDSITGGTGSDSLVGGAGNDSLYGAAGNDSLVGGDGNDLLDGGLGADVLTGGAGTDTATYASRTENLTISLDGIANDGAAGENDNVGADMEVVIGGSGNDTITGNTANNTLIGGDGNDLLDGGLGADSLVGGAGTDTVSYASRTENLTITLDGVANDGAAGENDNVGSDIEVVIGGTGNDTITGSAANDTLIGGDGDDSITGGIGNDSIVGGAGNDSLYGAAGNDTLIGGDGNDLLDGGLGSDSLVGGAGTDTAGYASRTENLNITLDGVANDGAAGENDNVGADIEVVIGGSGNDSITGGIGNDSLVGGAGNDSLYGAAGNDSLIGGDGNDLLDGGLGADSMAGGAGTDTVTYAARTENLTISLDGVANDGGAGENDNVGADIEVIIGGSGNDSITGGAGNESIVGGAGNDSLFGAGGNDSLIGGDGNDVLDGGLGADSLVGGAGTDTASYASRTENLTVTLDGVANDGAAGEKDNVSTDIEVVVGGLGNDTITGNSANNTIMGGDGNDLLLGGDGVDCVVGGNGNDLILGGSGNDCLQGNDGRDILIGGDNNDRLDGGAGDDILNGGVTNYDSNMTALAALMAEWSRTDIDYNTRVNHITGASGGGLNGTYVLNASTVHSSGLAPDSLTGGADNDLFFAASSGDKVLDKASNEKVVTVHT